MVPIYTIPPEVLLRNNREQGVKHASGKINGKSHYILPLAIDLAGRFTQRPGSKRWDRTTRIGGGCLASAAAHEGIVRAAAGLVFWRRVGKRHRGGSNRQGKRREGSQDHVSHVLSPDKFGARYCALLSFLPTEPVSVTVSDDLGDTRGREDWITVCITSALYFSAFGSGRRHSIGIRCRRRPDEVSAGCCPLFRRAGL